MIGFGTLLVIVLAGLAGPLVSVPRHLFVPVVVGEILAGILVGPHVIGAIDPAAPELSFLGEVGFAMLMLTVGMHLPLRDERLAGSLRAGGLQAAIVAVLAVPAGVLAASVASGGHAAVYAAVLASGSAAVLLPALQESGLASDAALRVMAQVTLADILTIISIPIVLQPARLDHVVLGTVLVGLTAALVVVLARDAAGRGWVKALRARSKHRHWALDLRLSLAVLFLLAWIAEEVGTTTLIAGFGAGIAVAIVGGPKRLSTQVRGIAEGFFVPLYFVLLGARLDVGGLFASASMLALAAVLVILTVGIRLIAAALGRSSAASALAASAQLGVPAAAASLGLADHVLTPVEATAIVTAALVSIAVATAGVDMLISREQRSHRRVPQRAA